MSRGIDKTYTVACFPCESHEIGEEVQTPPTICWSWSFNVAGISSSAEIRNHVCFRKPYRTGLFGHDVARMVSVAEISIRHRRPG